MGSSSTQFTLTKNGKSRIFRCRMPENDQDYSDLAAIAKHEASKLLVWPNLLRAE